jgi:cell wall-associated NlpC family hydrolase
MIKAKDIRIEIANGSQIIDITELLIKAEWSGSYQQACRKLSFSILASPYDTSIPRVDIQCGYVVRMFEDDKELFRGYIQSRDISYNSNSINYMALDGGTYVLRNELVYNFKNKTAEEITKQVCNDLGVPAGNLASTNQTMDKKFFGKGAYDIIMTAYTYASAKTNKKYMCLMDKGQLNVIEKGEVVLDLAFEEGVNITDSNFSEDISNMVNKVKVYSSEETFVKDITNDEDMKLYGTFSKVLKQEENKDTDAEAKNLLKKIERKATIDGFGDSSCITGYGVKVKDAYTGLVGLFYIDEDIHTFEEGIHKIKLTLAFENMMHEVDAEDKEESTSSSTTSSSTTSSDNIGAKIVEYAKSKLGCKYVWGATGENTFDCSGLTSWCHKQVGISIPRTSGAQRKSGTSVSKENAKLGDIVCFDGHVGIYVGDGQMIHAPNKSKPVKYDDCFSGHYGNKLLAIRRYW